VGDRFDYAGTVVEVVEAVEAVDVGVGRPDFDDPSKSVR
jgi:hypothetical protein